MLSKLSDFLPLCPFPIHCLDDVHPWVCVQLSKLKRRMLTEYKLAARTLTKYNGNHSGAADEDEVWGFVAVSILLFCSEFEGQ